MENSVLSTSKSWDLDKICRVCLVQKKDMRPLFGELVVDMLMDVARVAIVNTDGWPDKICVQCVHQVSRCHAFKMRVEKSDQELRNYIKSLTVIVEEPVMELPQQQQQRLNHSQNIISGRTPQMKTSPQHHQLTNATVANNPTRQLQTQTITTDLPGHHQQVVLSNGQLHNAQIINATQLMTHNGTPITQIVNANQLSQLIQTGNTVQMIQQNGQPAQVVQIQRTSDDHCEIIVHPDDDAQYFEDVTDQLQNEQDNDCIQNSENIIHINDEGDLEMEEEDNQTHISGEELTFELINSNSEEEVVESTEEEEEEEEEEELDDKEYIAEFINLQTTYIAPGRYSCNLCRKEFKQNKWLQNHMKSHSNWIKANCKKQPQCEICHRSFKGPGMLRMHMKTHEIVDKTPTCTICKKTFKSKTILYRHRQTHQQKSYQCGNCNKHFSSPYTLNSHMTKKHILERFKFKCAQCEEVFYVVEMLKVHMQNTGHNGKSFKSEDSS